MKTSRPLRSNTIANFVGLGYTASIGIIVLPQYLQYLGAEAFGLIGFFTLLQSWMQLFDMGMSPMLSRQAAQARGQVIDFQEFKKLTRSLEILFFIVAMIIALSIAAGSGWIVNEWLNVKSLDLTDVVICTVLMGVTIGLRFFTSLYRSGIQGMEYQVRLNIANIMLVTLKFVGALLLLHYVTQDFVHFFVYQFVIGIIELNIMAVMFYHLMPFTDRIGIRFSWNTLKPALPFATSIAYTAGIWVLLTQLDKMILSTILPLSEYGYYSLVAVIAAGIMQISGPISQAILPRMTHLLSEGREQEMLILYRKSTQLMAAIILPLTWMIALFSTELLFAWSGDRKAAEWGGPILFWFAMGNGILAMSAFQYYLQFAHGKLRMHVIYNTISASIQIPLIIYVAFEYGAWCVALTWFSLRAITFIIWTPVVHRKFAPGIHWPWLFADVAPVFISTATLLIFVDGMDIAFESMARTDIIFALFSIWLVVFMMNIFVSNASREVVLMAMKR